MTSGIPDCSVIVSISPVCSMKGLAPIYPSIQRFWTTRLTAWNTAGRAQGKLSAGSGMFFLSLEASFDEWSLKGMPGTSPRLTRPPVPALIGGTAAISDPAGTFASRGRPMRQGQLGLSNAGGRRLNAASH